MQTCTQLPTLIFVMRRFKHAEDPARVLVQINRTSVRSKCSDRVNDLVIIDSTNTAFWRRLVQVKKGRITLLGYVVLEYFQHVRW